MTSTTGSETFSPSQSAPPLVPQSPRSPPSFHGDRFENVEDRLSSYDRVAIFSQLDGEHKLPNVYFALQDSAKTWFENHEASFTTWEAVRQELLVMFSSGERKDKAKRAVHSRSQQSNKTIAMFVEDMTRISSPADLAMPEGKKVRHLIRSVKDQLFAGLLCDPPTTVADFAKEAASMESSLQEWGAQYGHQAGGAASHPSTICSKPMSLPAEELRTLVRSIVRSNWRNFTSKLHRQASLPSRKWSGMKSGV